MQGIFADDGLLAEWSQWDVAGCGVGSGPRGFGEVFGFCGFVDGACRFIGIDRKGACVGVERIESQDASGKDRIRTDAGGSIGVFPKRVDIVVGLQAFPLLHWVVVVGFDDHLVQVVFFEVGDGC